MQEEKEFYIDILNTAITRIGDAKRFHSIDFIYDNIMLACRGLIREITPINDILNSKKIITPMQLNKEILCLSGNVDLIRKFIGKATKDKLYRINEQGILENITLEDLLKVCDEILECLAEEVIKLQNQ